MVRVDEAIVVTYSRGGKNFEVLADPEKIVEFREHPDKINLRDVVAVAEIFKWKTKK